MSFLDRVKIVGKFPIRGVNPENCQVTGTWDWGLGKGEWGMGKWEIVNREFPQSQEMTV